ncbi:phospholipid scramblase 1-like isoform X1 [Onthophagus taurus]|uniref:phospholipid scramblase 1-like isoform X1 n=1 Tax=Onthophagus taurus TaxID=166361 RepID=UPI0039BDB08C
MFSTNRQGSNDPFDDHVTDIDLSVFNSPLSDSSIRETTTFLDTPDPIPIVDQPSLESNYPGSRRPIPVATIDWQSSRDGQFIPRNGLDFLNGVDKLFIQQTVELNELLANVDSENRYTIKVPRGETLYYASESSTNFQRFCCGSSRAFTMRLFDQTQQEAIEFRRRLAFGNCSFWCYLQVLEIWLPPGELVGYVKQQMTLSQPIFLAYNRHGNVAYKIEGPSDTCMCISNGKDKHFKIFNPEGTTQLGSVNYQWDQVQTDYIMCVQFPSSSIDDRLKAILLGAAFLLEYMYFERSKITGCLRCSC